MVIRFLVAITAQRAIMVRSIATQTFQVSLPEKAPVMPNNNVIIKTKTIYPPI